MITEIIGRFHPIVVHLPIGVFTLTFFMRYVYPRVGMTGSSYFRVALLFSFVCSIAAVIPGWLLSLSGDYNTETIGIHQWSAVALTILIGLLYWMEKWRGYLSLPFLYHALFVFSMGLLIVVGHAGGTLTHGEGYLFPDSDTASSVRGSSYTNGESVADTASASVYTALIDPLLHAKCQSCHRSKKIKGGLRLDGYEWILKGGKNGKILVSGDPASSELIRRIHLPIDEEKHMPPKGKNQLTEKEMALLHWWIAHGASASLSLKEVAHNDTIKPFLASISVAKQEEPVLSPKNPADSTLLANIKALGFTARPIAIGSGWLEVSAVNMASVKEEDLKKLLPLADHILWLNLSGLDLTDMQLDFLRSCIHIQKLNLSNTGISDAVATHLKKLPALTYLNVVGTFFSDKGLVEVCDMKSLRQLYGWKTKITQSSLANVYKKNPRLKIDLGAQ